MAISKIRNLSLAIVAVILSAAVFFGFQSQVNSSSLASQAQESVPIEIALSNSKPTLIEFYADWCGSCQAMAKNLAVLKNKYGQSVNFVMLNVDNTKWLPEVTKYRVDGIPRFIFLDANNQAIGDTTGSVPRAIMAANIEAAIANQPLPHNGINSDRTSAIIEPKAADISQPRDHGKIK